jgi:hypothetical protein
MRITVDLADDVVAHINRLRTERNARFKEIVNEALRLGLAKQRTLKKRKGSTSQLSTISVPAISIPKPARPT